MVLVPFSILAVFIWCSVQGINWTAVVGVAMAWKSQAIAACTTPPAE